MNNKNPIKSSAKASPRFKPYDELDITDNFMFGKIMRDPALCKQLLEIILGIKIKKISYPEEEKVINISSDGKSIRLDVYADDERGTVYNCEMQTSDTSELPKRTRYYQGMIDLNLIEKGQHYKELKPSFVIFICTFDPFREERYVYTFENRCIENLYLPLGDATRKVFLNAMGTKDPVSAELKAFLQYVASGKTNDTFTQSLDAAVKHARKNEDWRREFMTLQLRDMENREKGRQEGRQEGMTKAYADMFNNGDIKAETGANALEMTVEEFKKIAKSFAGKTASF